MDITDGQKLFTARNHRWGFSKFLRCHKLRDDGFLVGDKLIIVADVHALPTFSTPEEFEKFLESLRLMRVSFNRSKRDSSCQVVQKTENAASQEILDDDDASEDGDDDDGASEDDDNISSEEDSDDDGSSEEGSDDDDDASEEGSDDDDASSTISDDGGRGKSPLNQLNDLEGESLTVGTSKTEVSNVDNDDPPQGASHDDAFEDGQGDDDDASSLLSSVNDKDVSSINKLKSMEDASKTVENGDTGCTNVASVSEASNDLLKEIQPVKETMDVYGFHVFPSHVRMNPSSLLFSLKLGTSISHVVQVLVSQSCSNIVYLVFICR